MSPQPLAWSRPSNQRRREDLEFMAATGETTDGAARRLEINPEALDKWCQRHAPALWAQLMGNNHRGGAVRHGRLRRTA